MIRLQNSLVQSQYVLLPLHFDYFQCSCILYFNWIDSKLLETSMDPSELYFISLVWSFSFPYRKLLVKMLVSTICTLSTLSSDLKYQHLFNFLAFIFPYCVCPLLFVNFCWICRSTKVPQLNLFQTGLCSFDLRPLNIRNYSEIITHIHLPNI